MENVLIVLYVFEMYLYGKYETGLKPWLVSIIIAGQQKENVTLFVSERKIIIL